MKARMGLLIWTVLCSRALTQDAAETQQETIEKAQQELRAQLDESWSAQSRLREELEHQRATMDEELRIHEQRAQQYEGEREDLERVIEELKRTVRQQEGVVNRQQERLDQAKLLMTAMDERVDAAENESDRLRRELEGAMLAHTERSELLRQRIEQLQFLLGRERQARNNLLEEGAIRMEKLETAQSALFRIRQDYVALQDELRRMHVWLLWYRAATEQQSRLSGILSKSTHTAGCTVLEVLVQATYTASLKLLSSATHTAKLSQVAGVHFATTSDRVAILVHACASYAQTMAATTTSRASELLNATEIKLRSTLARTKQSNLVATATEQLFHARDATTMFIVSSADVLEAKLRELNAPKQLLGAIHGIQRKPESFALSILILMVMCVSFWLGCRRRRGSIEEPVPRRVASNRGSHVKSEPAQ